MFISSLKYVWTKYIVCKYKQIYSQKVYKFHSISSVSNETKWHCMSDVRYVTVFIYKMTLQPDGANE